MSKDQDAESATARAAYKILGQLARAGAYIEEISAGDSARQWRLVVPAQQGERHPRTPQPNPAERRSSIASEMFAHLCANQWIRLYEARWVISRQGAETLRRHRAAGSGPIETGAAVAPPAESCSHQTRAPHSDYGTARLALINELESPLGWLRRRKDKGGKPLMSDAQFEAGERLRADFHRAHMSPRITASWDGIAASRRMRRGVPGQGVDLADHVMTARTRVTRALTAVGPELGSILLDVCCHLKGLEAVETSAGLPQRSGKVVLLIALSLLARHYGLLSDADSLAPLRRRIGHWGAEDYRPSLESWL